MNKLEQVNRVRKIMMYLIIGILIGTFSIILITYIWKNHTPDAYTSLYRAREIGKYPCLSKGNVCSADDIRRAIKVKIPVNNKETYNFYLISNDENSATYIMDRNIIQKEDWHNERINLKGPYKALTVLSNMTENWITIPSYEYYKYKDEGYQEYRQLCQDSTEYNIEASYDCSTDEIETRGYKGVLVKHGVTKIYWNLPGAGEVAGVQTFAKIDKPLNARMIELNEVYNLLDENGYLPDWMMDNLQDNHGYWTMSSSTAPAAGYMEGVIGVVRNGETTTINLLYPLNDYNYGNKVIGIRPVITLPKEERP